MENALEDLITAGEVNLDTRRWKRAYAVGSLVVLIVACFIVAAARLKAPEGGPLPKETPSCIRLITGLASDVARC
jgi:hypothetical protein